ncbi:hypothetical protein NCS56_00326700 [Fusarium sp. Ph1]|nr:hypothetical protein NCS56_00326700 [Fusarium sp. Ph1]
MTSCPSPLWQPAGAPYLWEAFQDVHQSFKRMLKKYQHVSDSPNDPWLSSRSRGRPVAKFTKDPLLSSLDPKIFTTATHLAHFCLDTFSRDQDCLELSSKDIPTPTPILASDSLHFTSRPSRFLRTLHNLLKPSRSALFSTNFTLRALHWFCGFLMTENSCTPDALVYVRSDKYLETSSHRGNPSSDGSFVEASSTSYLRRENADNQADPSSPLCVSFVEESREQWSIRGPCASPENTHNILPSDGVNGCDPITGNILIRSEGSSDPEDNASSIKRQEHGNSRAPEDGETSQKPSKSQKPNSHYDEGTNGTTKAGKKRKRDSPERDDDDFDDSGRGSGRPNTGKRRKDEEEESEKNKFACPFYKNDPQAFRASRTCVGPGWSSVHRVKEHIFRRHMLSDTQCHHCMEDFETQVALDEHIETPCRRKPPLKSHGINKKQEGQLRSRKMYQKSLDEEEKWRAIYKIIFPDEENIPSPYYEPEVPEFPDYYRQMLIQKLPGIVTEQLRAAGPGLMRHITDDVMANQHCSTSGFGSKSNLSENPQLVRQIENVVEIALRKTLSEVDRSKEQPFNDFQIPRLNVESPEEESKNSIKQEKQVPLIGPTPLQDDFLLPPGIGGNGLKIETRAQYPTPTSSAFSRSPEFQFGNMERSQMGSTSPLELDLASMFGESHLDDSLLHTTEGGSIAELPSVTWDNNDTVFSSGMYTPIRQNSNPNVSNVSGPASDQTQAFVNLGPRPEEYLLGSWDFPPQVTSIQSVDSGYGSIAGPPDSTALDNLDLDSWLFE